MHRAKNPATGQGTVARFSMIRHEEFLGSLCLEALQSTPYHLPDRKACAVGHDDVVQDAIRNDRVIQAIYFARKDRNAGDKLLSVPLMNTSVEVHSAQICWGALITASTSLRFNRCLHLRGGSRRSRESQGHPRVVGML